MNRSSQRNACICGTEGIDFLLFLSFFFSDHRFDHREVGRYHKHSFLFFLSEYTSQRAAQRNMKKNVDGHMCQSNIFR